MNDMITVRQKKRFWFRIMIILFILLIVSIIYFFNSLNSSDFILINDSVTLILGDKLSLSNRPNSKYEWESIDDTVVIVDEYGFIEAVGEGTTIVRVRYKEHIYSCKVIVKAVEDAIQTESITLVDNSLSLKVGESVSLKYSIEPRNATNKNVTLYSSDLNVVVIENGKVFARGVGKAIVSVVTGDGNLDTCDITVISNQSSVSGNSGITDYPNSDDNVSSSSISVDSIRFEDESITLNKGDNYKLSYVITPSNANTTIIWNSSDKRIVSVDDSGMIFAKKAGTVTITINTSDGKKDTVKVTVVENSKVVEVESITLDSSDVTLSVGDTLKVNATIKPVNSTYKNITWISGNENVAVVEDGLITAKWGGVATITARTNDGRSSELKVTVKNYNLILDDNNFLTTNGTKIVKKNNGKQVLLRGFNLGAWLSRSLAFMPVVPVANTKEELNNKGYSCVNSEAFMQALLKNSNVGSSRASTLSKILYDNFITESDLDLIAQSGATVVRVPFEYSLLMNDNGTYKTNSNGEIDFYYLDWIVEQCKKRGIYVILDLHLVPGRQNQGGWCDDYTFFKNITYQNNVIDMWGKIAEHFVNEEAVAGYEIINEPQATKKVLVTFYDKAYKSIRNVDNNHIIFMEETCVYCGYSGTSNSSSIGDLPKPSLIDSSIGKNNKWTNVVYSTHDYFYDRSNGEPQYDTTAPAIVKSRMYEKTKKIIAKSKEYNVPYYIGEFSHLGNWSNYSNYLSVWEEAMTYYDNNNLNYTPWTYKGHWDRYFGTVFYGSNITKANIETDSYSTLEKVFSSQSSTAMKFNKDFYLMFLKQWNGRLASSITLSYTSLSLNIGDTKVINYTVNIDSNRISGGYKTYDVINKKGVWSSDNINVISIDSSTGKMTANGIGTATITLTLYPLMLSEKSVSATCVVMVK